jgi:uncharacterized NAD-dependent epimerase/dehydratase family protein
MIRYKRRQVVCVIDSTNSGRTVEKVLGFGGDIPVVASLTEAVAYKPDTLLLGIAPRGGALPGPWRRIILGAIDHGLDIISGLHTMLGDDAEIAEAAAGRQVRIWDIRKPVFPTEVSRGALFGKRGRVLLTVGSDCRTGKMTVAYELACFLNEKGLKSEFVPTGQTGILLAGWGVAVDRVPGDFMARVMEDLTLQALAAAPLAIVEGQGSLIHPGYSGVALAMLHGCCPDGLVLCHDPGRKEIRGFATPIPALPDLIRIYEQAAAPVFPTRVVAIALNTYSMSEEAAAEAVRAARAETGVNTTDVIRWGPESLYKALEDFL